MTLSEHPALRQESKNGQHKRKIKMGNNSKNILKSIMTNENHMHGILRKYGWFKTDELSVVKVSEETSSSDPFHDNIQSHLNNGALLANKIVFKNVEYNCDGHSCILLHENESKSEFSFGLLIKFLVKKSVQGELEVNILYQATNHDYLENFGLFKIEPTEQFRIVKINSLATFSPLNLYTANPLSKESFTVVSLRNKPILFP